MLVLNGVLAGQVFEILNVLVVDLVKNFLEVLGPDPIHISIKLLLLLLGQQLAWVSALACVGGLLVLPVGAVGRIHSCLLIGGLSLCHLRNLLLPFSFEVLVYSVLHRVDPFLEA